MTSFLRTLTRHGRHAGLGFAMAGSLLLAACGGGDNATANPSASASSVPTRSVTTAAVAVIPSAPSVTTITKLSETRVSRTEYDYVFRVTVTAGSLAYNNVSATLTAVGNGTTILDGSVAVGNMAPFAVVTPATDTIKLRVNRSLPFNLAALQWQVGGAAQATGTVNFVVRDAGGALLPNTVVTLGGLSGTTDPQGRVQLNGVPAGTETVVKVQRSGFVAQALRFTPQSGQDNALAIDLKAVGDTIPVPHIESAQVIAARDLDATVTLPALAFVKPDGSPASGAATVRLTPWNVSGNDLLAMPGNGRAKDASGALVDLVSLGMLSVEFLDASGQALRLAPGKTARIEMVLPYGELLGQAMTPGTTIPLWHFDEAQGLWIEEGAGTVVEGASDFGPGSGRLHLRADVSHFSSWNWDLKFASPGSITVRCVDTAGVATACSVRASLTLADGSHLVKSASLPAGGSTIVNMPTDASIEWLATDTHGFTGTASSSGAGSNVVITIDPIVRTHHTVRCVKPDGTGLACKLRGSYTVPASEPLSLETSIPAEGAVIESGYPATSVDWEVISATESSGLEVTRYQGFASLAAPTGTVTVPLFLRDTYTMSPLPVFCSSQGALPVDGVLVPEPISACTLSINGDYDSSGLAWNLDVTLPTGSIQSVLLPPYSYGYVRASAVTPSGNFLQIFFKNLLDLNASGVLEFDFTDLSLPAT